MKKITLKSLVRQAPGVVSKVIGNSVIILDADRASMRDLNEVATLIWQGIENWKSVSDLIGEMKAEFDVDESILKSDVLDFLNAYVKLNLIEIK